MSYRKAEPPAKSLQSTVGKGPTADAVKDGRTETVMAQVKPTATPQTASRTQAKPPTSSADLQRTSTPTVATASSASTCEARAISTTSSASSAPKVNAILNISNALSRSSTRAVYILEPWVGYQPQHSDENILSLRQKKAEKGSTRNLGLQQR